MAQPTQWVPAILDYMKKAKSNISTSHPYPPVNNCISRSTNITMIYCSHWRMLLKIEQSLLTIKKTEEYGGKMVILNTDNDVNHGARCKYVIMM